MIIIKSNTYKKELDKKIIKKHKNEELKIIESIENLILSQNNLKELMNNPYHLVYNIEKKKGNLKEYYTAKINPKLRLYLKPIGKYPYNTIEIEEIVFDKIDDKHYGEG